MVTDALLLLVILVAGQHLSVAAVPSMPTSLKVANVRSGNISISWRHGGGPVDYFRVTLADLAPNTVVKNYTSQNYNGTLKMYFAVTPGTTYQIYVTAVGKDYNSSSRLITFTAGPATPTSLKVTRVHDTDSISISWRHGGGPVDYFRVTLEDNTRGQRNVKNYTRQNYSVILMMTFPIIPGTAYKIYVAAFVNGLSSTSDLDYNAPVEMQGGQSTPTGEKQGGKSTPHAEKHGGVTTPFPSRPISLNVTYIRNDNISITWKHGGGPVDYFTVTMLDLGLHAVVKNYTSRNYNGTLMTYFAVQPSITYQIYVTAYENGSSSLSRLITFTAAGDKQGGKSNPHGEKQGVESTTNGERQGGTSTLRTSIQCYVCNASNCSIARTSTDPKQECPVNHACWMYFQVNRIIRRCDTKPCSTEFQTWARVTESSKVTYSKCCTGDACNAEVVTDTSGLAMVEFPLMISCLFVVLTSFFVLA